MSSPWTCPIKFNCWQGGYLWIIVSLSETCPPAAFDSTCPCDMCVLEQIGLGWERRGGMTIGGSSILWQGCSPCTLGWQFTGWTGLKVAAGTACGKRGAATGDIDCRPDSRGRSGQIGAELPALRQDGSAWNAKTIRGQARRSGYWDLANKRKDGSSPRQGSTKWTDQPG